VETKRRKREGGQNETRRDERQRKKDEKKTNLRCLTFREVDDDSPSEIEIVVLDGDESTRLEEGEGVGRVGDDVSEILTEFVKLLLPIVVLSDGFLVRDDDLGAFDLGETEFCGERERKGKEEEDETGVSLSFWTRCDERAKEEGEKGRDRN